jgi:hypothetical protein
MPAQADKFALAAPLINDSVCVLRDGAMIGLY